MLRVIFLLGLILMLPAPASAADGQNFISGHEGQTMVQIGDRITWLDNDQIAGQSWWVVKVKCYRGDRVAGETELQVIDGYTGNSRGESTRGYWNPRTGQMKYKTRLNFFVYLDSRHPDPYVVTGQDPEYQDVLAQVQAFSLGPLTLYVHSQGADRFEAELYSSHGAGYTLDSSLPIPRATQNDDAPLTFVSELKGALQPRDTPLVYDHYKPIGVIDGDGRLHYYLPQPDGSYNRVQPKDQSGLVMVGDEVYGPAVTGGFPASQPAGPEEE